MATSLFAAVATLSVAASAQDIAPAKEGVAEPTSNYSPFVERTVRSRNFAEGLYSGDTHLHTMFSTDAGMVGNTVAPEDTYEFSRGEEVVTSSGQPVRIERPLDFLVAADHAETRIRWEPIVEVTQINGDGEAHPALSPDDKFEDYGTWDKADIAALRPKTSEMLPFE